jgi:hypothetical protein
MTMELTDFPTARPPEALTRAPCCADPACGARRLDAELATAFRAACAGVEALRATHLRHAARDRCPPGRCRCRLDRLVTASAHALDTARTRLEWLRELVDAGRAGEVRAAFGPGSTGEVGGDEEV